MKNSTVTPDNNNRVEYNKAENGVICFQIFDNNV